MSFGRSSGIITVSPATASDWHHSRPMLRSNLSRRVMERQFGLINATYLVTVIEILKGHIRMENEKAHDDVEEYQEVVNALVKCFYAFRRIGVADASYNPIELDSVRLPGVSFRGADLRRGLFKSSDFSRSAFNRCVLNDANFEQAVLHEADFAEARLIRTRLRYANLGAASFIRTICVAADFSSANINFTDFSGADVHMADFSNVDVGSAIGLPRATYTEAGQGISFNPNLLRKVDELALSVRSANVLKNDNIVYIGDLVQKTEDEFLRTSSTSRRTLDEIKEVLAEIGLHLGMEVAGWPPENIEELARKIIEDDERF
jgi:hypothetical protein